MTAWDKRAAIAAAGAERRHLLDTTFAPLNVSEAYNILTLAVSSSRKAFVNLVALRTSKHGIGWGCRACGRTGGYATTYGLNLDDLQDHSRTAEIASASLAMFVNRHNRCL